MKLLLLPLLVILVGCSLPRPTKWKEQQLLDKTEYTICLDQRMRENQGNINILVLSAGGTNGAWSAGVLNGWKDRPKFDVVSGVSAGALNATCAFLGTDRDYEVLAKSYKELTTEDLIDFNKFFGIPYATSVSSNRPLKRLIRKNLTDEAINRIAEEGAKGRRLLIGVTNQDTGRLDIFDLTKIACSVNQDRYDKIRKIVLASASIPLIYEPIFIDGYMYSDGGIRSSLFIAYPDKPIRGNLYVIINGQPGGTGQIFTKNSMIGIASRSLHLIIDSIMVSNLKDIHNETYMRNMNFNLSYVPPGIKLIGLDFKQEDITNIYEAGYEWGKKSIWFKVVPDVR